MNKAINGLTIGQSTYRDKWTLYNPDGSESYAGCYYDTRQQLIDANFSAYAWPGGYPLVWTPVDEDGDGECVSLCADCAKALFCSDDDTTPGYRSDLIDDQGSYAMGLLCDGCNQPIIEIHCVDCVDTLDELTAKGHTLFSQENGDYAVCSHCIAKLVVKGDATKTGKQTYQVKRFELGTNSGEWYAGTYTGPRGNR